MVPVRRVWTAAALLAAGTCQGAPPPAGHPLLGTWQLVLPVGKCVETYQYRSDGTSHTVSAAEETDTVYEVSATPNEHGYYVLKDTIRVTNGKPDCSGQLTPTNKLAFEEYVQDSGVGAIIVERAWSEEWMYNFGDLGLKGVTVGGVTIYDTANVKPPTDQPKAG